MNFKPSWDEQIDLTPWIKLNSDELDQILVKFFDKYEWSIDSNNMVTPKGRVYFDALMELRSEKAEVEDVQILLKDIPKYQHLQNDIINIETTNFEWADCGCCIRGGGERTVHFLNNIILKFDRHGNLLEDDNFLPKFSWLRNNK